MDLVLGIGPGCHPDLVLARAETALLAQWPEAQVIHDSLPPAASRISVDLGTGALVLTPTQERPVLVWREGPAVSEVAAGVVAALGHAAELLDLERRLAPTTCVGVLAAWGGPAELAALTALREQLEIGLAAPDVAEVLSQRWRSRSHEALRSARAVLHTLVEALADARLEGGAGRLSEEVLPRDARVLAEVALALHGRDPALSGEWEVAEVLTAVLDCLPVARDCLRG